MGKDTLKELLGYHNFAKDCPKAQKALKGAGRSNEKPNRRRGGGSGGAGGSARQLAFIAGDVNRDRSWIMDSGATSHVTYDASELSQVQRLPRAEEFETMGVCCQVLKTDREGNADHTIECSTRLGAYVQGRLCGCECRCEGDRSPPDRRMRRNG